MSIFFFFFSKDITHFNYCFFWIHNTWRVVRWINNNCFSLFIYCCFKFFHVNLKCSFFSRNLYNLSTWLLNKNSIFREERRKYDTFFILFHYCIQYDCKRCCCTTSHIDIIFCYICSKFFIYIISNCISYMGIPLCWCVTMCSYRIAIFNNINNCFLYTFRSRNTWITNTEIKYIFCTNFLFTFISIFKYFSYLWTNFS